MVFCGSVESSGSGTRQHEHLSLPDDDGPQRRLYSNDELRQMEADEQQPTLSTAQQPQVYSSTQLSGAPAPQHGQPLARVPFERPVQQYQPVQQYHDQDAQHGMGGRQHEHPSTQGPRQGMQMQNYTHRYADQRQALDGQSISVTECGPID